MEIQNNQFNYAALLKQVKARVAFAQKKLFMQRMKNYYPCIGISGSYCRKVKNK